MLNFYLTNMQLFVDKLPDFSHIYNKIYAVVHTRGDQYKKKLFKRKKNLLHRPNLLFHAVFCRPHCSIMMFLSYWIYHYLNCYQIPLLYYAIPMRLIVAVDYLLQVQILNSLTVLLRAFSSHIYLLYKLRSRLSYLHHITIG